MAILFDVGKGDLEGEGAAFPRLAGHRDPAAVLLGGFLEGHLGIGELEEAIEELARTIWLSPAVVAEVLRRAREMSK